jgi:hypothetical protein
MSEASADPGELDLGQVIQGTFGVLRRNLVTFGALGLILSGIPTGILTFLQADFIRDQASAMANGQFNFSPGYIAAVSMGGLAALITTAILQGALIYATVQDLNGQRPTIAASLATGLRNFLPLLAVTILLVLGAGLGMVLLIVPGLMLLCAWCVAVPSLIADRTGIFGAFTRAAQLTRGNRWRIFGLGVLAWIVLLVVQVIYGAITGVSSFGQDPLTTLDRASTPLALSLNVISNTIGSVIGSAAVAVLYVELRKARDGLGPQWLSEIFS